MTIHHALVAIEQWTDDMIQNPKIQVAAGSILTATPIWVTQIQNWAGAVAAVAGAFIAVHGAYRIIRAMIRKHS